MEHLVVWLRWIAAAHDGLDEARAAAAQARAVAARLVAVGGEVRALLSGTVVATFDPEDAIDAVEALLDLCDEVDRGESPVRPAFGVALGLVEVEGGVLVGSAVDHAQGLAARARDGEVVLEREARDRSAHALLFTREVTAGPAGPRGFAVDRAHPRREACREALAGLAPPPIAPAQEALASAIARAAAGQAATRVLLRGSFAAGSRALVTALARTLRPALVLDLPGVPGGLDPLGSLGAALRLADPPLEGIPPAAAEAIRALAAGRATPRTDARAALDALLARHARDGRAVWFLLDPVSALDPASVELVAESTAHAGAAALVFARLPEGAAPPQVLLEGAPTLEYTLPPLGPVDALAVACGVLGADAEPSVARKLALIGGDTTMGIVEAAHALVATGDIVRQGERLAWRQAPRAASGPAPLKSLVTERLGLLDETAHRVLEALCVLAEAAPLDVARILAEQDGLDTERFTRGLTSLRAEGLWAPSASPALPTFLVRTVVLEAMHPARTAKLHRFAARALRTGPDAETRAFRLGTLASHLAEGGMPEDAGATLLEAAHHAREAGFERAAVRLAAAAVRVDPRDGTRRAAAALTSEQAADDDATTPTPQPADSDRPEATDTAHRAVRAIIARDFDAVDRVVEAALAAGGAPAAAERIRAVAQLARGDAGRALRTLRRQQGAGPTSDADSSRAMLALALVLAGSGDPVGAVRAAVAALASTRRRHDASGEEAALRTLARCYRALGRVQDAERFDSRT